MKPTIYTFSLECDFHLKIPQKSPSEAVNSLPQNITSAYQAEAPPHVRAIPGPAGIVQSAKLRKTRDMENILGQEEHPMATQEYIRRVVENPEEDDDFQGSPWLSAIEFVYSDGMFNSVPNAPLGDINKYLKNGKLHQVVAVIKSCTSNELGDLKVTLKDPTGVVSGTIHHKVLTEGEFGKGIFVGSVLILHKVSVFSPSRSSHYLNITKRNLVKVFYKDNGSSQTQTFHGCKVIDRPPASDLEQGATTTTSGPTFSLEQIAKKMTNVTKTTTYSQQNSQENVSPFVSSGPKFTETLKESNHNITKRNLAKIAQTTMYNGHGTTKTSGPTFSLEQIAKKMANVTNKTSANSVSTGPHFTETLKESDVIKSGLNENPGFGNGLKGMDPSQVQVEPTMVSGSIPVWTDEQLNELFDDFVDDM
ncbi:unnamed protein product [Lactuca virosa]|uniref:Homologous recombination OB-fold protein OB-fold domain-containing protein n=1 Tax=Lactuca virosa TaxID=75947 RepID=A0AAU9NB37_9ASTR|nr:unnamed protein product [Lactuca virosa]